MSPKSSVFAVQFVTDLTNILNRHGRNILAFIFVFICRLVHMNGSEDSKIKNDTHSVVIKYKTTLLLCNPDSESITRRLSRMSLVKMS